MADKTPGKYVTLVVKFADTDEITTDTAEAFAAALANTEGALAVVAWVGNVGEAVLNPPQALVLPS